MPWSAGVLVINDGATPQELDSGCASAETGFVSTRLDGAPAASQVEPRRRGRVGPGGNEPAKAETAVRRR